jgi:lysine 2,3-aminomutase
MAFATSKRSKPDQWENWVWQQSHAAKDLGSLIMKFPSLDQVTCQNIADNSSLVRFQLTPYMLSLVETDIAGRPLPADPIWQQYVPCYDPLASVDALSSSLADNWELPGEMITPILQHKYENRVNFRIQNRCLAYCTYCFEAKRVLDRASTIQSFRDELFRTSLDYIRSKPVVAEVVVSGGEALTLSNERLERILSSIREIPHIRALRIQTRAFSHNPFRIDEGFVKLCVRHNVNAMGLHVSHPKEITSEFKDAVNRFSHQGCRTILLAHIPLLKGINDDPTILEELFMALYTLNIKPYYLLHAMPETFGFNRFRTSVRRGVELMSKLKRRISNPAMPEYIIVHSKGKHTVPLDPRGSDEFRYQDDGYIRFKNWRGEWCDYLDGPDL